MKLGTSKKTAASTKWLEASHNKNSTERFAGKLSCLIGHRYDRTPNLTLNAGSWVGAIGEIVKQWDAAPVRLKAQLNNAQEPVARL